MADYPITPPPELVEQWLESTRSDDCIGAYPANYERVICTAAARWGADQELEACRAFLLTRTGTDFGPLADTLRAARRPKPPSLKEQALKAARIELAENGRNAALIIRALEALPDV